MGVEEREARMSQAGGYCTAGAVLVLMTPKRVRDNAEQILSKAEAGGGGATNGGCAIAF